MNEELRRRFDARTGGAIAKINVMAVLRTQLSKTNNRFNTTVYDCNHCNDCKIELMAFRVSRFTVAEAEPEQRIGSSSLVARVHN